MKKFLIAGLISLAACGGEAPKPEASAVAETASADVTLALKIAKGIEADPAAVDSLLLANGLTRPGFDSLLYRIAEDPKLSADYAAGRR